MRTRPCCTYPLVIVLLLLATPVDRNKIAQVREFELGNGGQEEEKQMADKAEQLSASAPLRTLYFDSDRGRNMK